MTEKIPDGFREFYAAYPRKRDPRLAMKSYKALRKRHPDVTAEDLAWAAGEYARQVQKEGTEPRFVKHPSTWLNADSFEEFFEGGDYVKGS